jgi:hypothetical protein
VSRAPDCLRAARAVALACEVHSLLSAPLSNPKVAKSHKAGRAFTAPMHLAPAASSGFGNVCPHAGACEALCLDGAGNPAYESGKARARKARTALWFNARAAFMTLLVAEIAAHVRAARVARMRCAVRLNATSDILWERFPVTVSRDLATYLRATYGVRVRAGEHASVMHAFPRVQFYDYTKVPPQFRLVRIPANYHLTYSYDPHNAEHVAAAIAAGMNVAVPFQGRELPAEFMGLPVIDGDRHDYRPADPGQVIVGLRFKRITSRAVIARVGAHAARTGAGFAVSIN